MDQLDEKFRWLSMGLICGIAVGSLAAYAIIPRGQDAATGVWQPSGDGKTVLNTVTGEMKETATGRPVSAVEDVRKEPAKRASYTTLIRSSEAIYENECKRFFGERQSWHQRQNAAAYERLETFVDAHPEIDGVGSISQFSWELSTRAFRVDQPLTPPERDRLLDFLVEANDVDPYNGDDSFRRAIDDLKQLRY